MLAIIIAGISAVAALRVQKQDSASQGNQQKFDRDKFESQFPIVDYNAPDICRSSKTR